MPEVRNEEVKLLGCFVSKWGKLIGMRSILILHLPSIVLVALKNKIWRDNARRRHKLLLACRADDRYTGIQRLEWRMRTMHASKPTS